jgi:prepilin-type N-terminal cleavage/methylation domain-containing protein
MLRKLNSSQSGFTLVEIMIVVAIIALLAAIAVPNFLRARKRSQATAILEEMRLIDAAKDQYAIENNLIGNATVNWTQARVHMKPGTRLANATAVTDLLGNTVTLGAIDTPPTLNSATVNNFTDVVPSTAAFWGSYAP